jgi:Ca2+-binding RTX toxin-like protein
VGQDKLYGGDDADTVDAGADADLAYGGAGSDTVDGGAANDSLYGGDGLDRLTGGIGNDLIYGGNDADTVMGDIGADQLFGGAGNDFMSGSSGNDTVAGGDGADRFVFRPATGRDTITDFDTAAGDRLLLDHRLWTGTLTAGQVVQTFATMVGDDLHLTFSGGNVVQINDFAGLSGLAAFIDLI